MADDSAKQVIGTVGGAVSCFIFWTTATIANDRLLSHLERRYYDKNNTNNNTNNATQNPGQQQQQQQPSILGLSSTGAGSGLSRFLTSRNKISWAKDNRLLFYLLAIWCSITYAGLILTMLLASYNPNSSIADLGSFFSVATYLSMIVMVFWTVLEGVETVKRLGIYNQNQMPSRANNTTTIATNGTSGRRKSRQGGTTSSKKKSGNIRSSMQQKKSGGNTNIRGSQIQQQHQSTLPNEAASSEDVSAFSMSHPTGSELQGEDDDDEDVVDVDNMNNNNYGGAGESGLSGGDEDDSHYYNDSYHNNAGDYGVVYNGHPDDAEAWLPSTSEQNDSFYDDSYGAALDDNDDGFGSIAGQSANNNIAGGTRSSVTNSVSTHNNTRTKGINVSSNNNTITNNGNNTTTVNTLPGNTSSSGRLSQNSHNIVAMSTNSTFVSNGYRNNNNNNQNDNNNNEDACCSSDDCCDPWEHRGFISLCAIFVLYFVFNMAEQSLKTMDGVDYKIGQWGSVVMSFIIAMVCIFQSVNTYQSFKNTSQDLAFLFVSIFGTLAFFLILRTIMVFPPVQASLGKYLTVAFIPNCDAVSMLFLLLRVPRAK